ncbi:MAG: hypothetical protein NZ959_08345 [Armatimonadetes bacterium]|nr:hypothetical protein [Armatimonadota bacterium]MDW8121786.1 DUF6785 family protein [Armatimonadota bacterium]
MTSPASPPVRFFVLIGGLLLIPLLCLWVVEAEIVVATVHATILSLPFAAAFVTTIIIFVNGLFQRYLPRLSLSSVEILILYCMMAVATTLFSIDTMTLLIPMMGHPFWFATPENRWSDLFHPYLPDWLTVRDRDILRGYYYGGASFWEPVVFLNWLTPLLWWLLFVSSLLVISGGLGLFLSKRWLWEERLSYPLTRYPLELTVGKAIKAKTFWYALLIVAFIELINGFHSLYPQVPQMKLMIDLTPFFQTEPWRAIGSLPVRFYPLVSGSAYFAPTDLTFSLWLFFVLWKVQMVVRHWLGWRFPGTYLGEQVCGAWLGLAAATLWRGRASWVPSVKFVSSQRGGKAFGLSSLVAAITFISFLAQSGMGWAVAVAWATLYWMLVLASGRMRAELGPPTHELHFIGPEALLVHTIGSTAFSTRHLTAMSLFYWLVYGFRAHPLPSLLESLKIAERSLLGLMPMTAWCLCGGLAGALSAPIVLLSRFYRLGALSKVQGYSIYPSVETYQRLAEWLTARPSTRWDIVRELLIGLGLFSAMMVARSYWLWFPLHPVGYTVGTGWTMSWMWFSVLIGWMVKTVVLRYWGYRGYQRTMPFMVGAITGQILGGSGWAAYGAIVGKRTYSFFP